MRRIKSLFVAGAVVAALATLVRQRLVPDQPVDTGGWKPVDPA